MKFEYWGGTDLGREAKHNEDAYLCDDELGLFIVADGLGGHQAGDVASTLCVRSVRDTVAQNRDMLDRLAGGSAERSEILRMLEHAVQASASLIRAKAVEQSGKKMGCTCSLLMLAGERGYIAHVGDSRIYLVRGNKVHQLSEDHCLANELSRRGKITLEDLESSPYRGMASAVTRAVGIYENVEVDTFDLKVQPGDRFLLCSDGQHRYVDGAIIAETMVVGEPQAIVERLIALANQGGGEDNITSVVVRVTGVGTDTHPEVEIDLPLELPLFGHFTRQELAELAGACELRRYTDEKTVTATETKDALLVVLEGALRLIDLAGVERARLGPGEMASSYPLRGVTEGTTRLLLLRWPRLSELLLLRPRLAHKLLWSALQVLARPRLG